MKKPRSLEELKALAADSREMQRKDPNLMLKDIGKHFNVDISYLCRIRKRFPDIASDDLPKELVTDVMAEFNKEVAFEDNFEVVKVSLFSKKKLSFLNRLDIEMKIPAGLKGDKRKMAIYSAIKDQIGFDET